MIEKTLFKMLNIIRNYEKLSPSSALIVLNFYIYKKLKKEDEKVLKFFKYIPTISEKTQNYLNNEKLEKIPYESYITFLRKVFRGEAYNNILPGQLIDFINFNIYEKNKKIAANFIPLSKEQKVKYTVFNMEITMVTSSIYILNILKKDIIKNVRTDIISIGDIFNNRYEYVITKVTDVKSQYIDKKATFFEEDIKKIKEDIAYYKIDINCKKNKKDKIVQYETKKRKIPLFEVEIYNSLKMLKEGGFATLIINKEIYESQKNKSYFKNLFLKYSLKSITLIPPETWTSIGAYYNSYVIVLQNKKPNINEDKINILLPESLGITETGAYIDISEKLYKKMYEKKFSIYDNSNFFNESEFYQYSIKDYLNNNSLDVENLFIEKKNKDDKYYKLSDLIKEVKRKKIKVNKKYKKISISIKKGISIKEEETSQKKTFYQAKEGDFVLSKLSTHQGGFGIIEKKDNNAVISNSFLLFEIIRPDLINPYYLSEILKKDFYLKKFKNIVYGISGRKYINKDKFLDTKIKLIKKEEQEKKIKEILETKKEIFNLNNKLEKMLEDIL